MKYGFLGAGNMASAIIRGMVKSGIHGSDIGVYDLSVAATDVLKKECGVEVCSDQSDLTDAKVLVIAIKPQILDIIIESIKNDLGSKKPLIVSIAIGKTIDYLENNLGADKAIVRVMPNINAKVLASTSGYCINPQVTPVQEEIVSTIFGAVGTLTKLEEDMFSIFGALAGSSPAFTYLYIDSLARAAQKAGMSKKQALEIVSSTVLGSAKMVLESKEHPWELIDQVCSPGGTTIEGICRLEANCFEKTIVDSFDAIMKKDKKIQNKKKV